MARPRKPTALMELSGAYDRNPGRRRPPAPIPDGPVGDPPARLQGAARAYWFEIVAMVPANVLGCSDRWCVELAARLMHKANMGAVPEIVYQLAKAAEMTPQETKALIQEQTMRGADWSLLRSLLASMGMTPADREKLSVPPEKPKNRFSELAAESKSGKPN